MCILTSLKFALLLRISRADVAQVYKLWLVRHELLEELLFAIW